MKTMPIIKQRQIVSRKVDYSHVESRLFSSLSKSKEKPTYLRQQIPPIAVKESLQKVQQIGQEKYKQAMKHMRKLNKYEQEMKRRQKTQNQLLDSECTFKPKLYNNKKYSNQTSRFMTTSFTERYLQRNKEVNPQKNDFNQSVNITRIKNGNFKKNGDQIKTQNQSQFQEVQLISKRKSKGIQLADRLIRWAKDRDMKIMNRTIEIEIEKSISRGSSISPREKSGLCKQFSYSKFFTRKQAMNQSLFVGQTPERKGKSSMILNATTPISQRLQLQNMGRSMISEGGNNQRENLSKNKVSPIYLSKTDQGDTISYETQKKKRFKLYTEMDLSMRMGQTVGERLLSRQADRGEGSFYLRQAKANIIKTCEKTDILMKNNKYSRRFANQSNALKIQTQQ